MKSNNIYIKIVALLLLPIPNYAQSDVSYMQSRKFTQPGEAEWLDTRITDNGLGDIERTTSFNITPEHKDIVQLHEYDQYRRPYKTWLPIVCSNANSESLNALKSIAVNFYNDKEPYNFTDYKFSPLILEDYKAGSIMHNHKKGIKTKKTQLHAFEYRFADFFSSNEFTCSFVRHMNGKITENEDGQKVAEGFDLSGKYKLVSRQYDGNNSFTTYYVYDHYNRLRYVLPPTIGNTLTGFYPQYKIDDKNQEIMDYAYIYNYDGCNRIIYKKIPGCAPIYYIYDKSGNMILSQNGTERGKGVWHFYIPDIFGRTVITGLCSNIFNYKDEPLFSTFVKANRVKNNPNGYDIDGINLLNETILTINYYDDYSFVGTDTCPKELEFSSLNNNNTPYYNTKGLLTGTKIAIVDSLNKVSKYLYEASYYDYEGRIIQHKSSNNLGGFDTNCNQYSYTGKVLNSYNVHTIKDGNSLQTESINYTYDHADRLLKVTHKLNDNNEITLYQNVYDELGRLKSHIQNNSQLLQTTSTYNINSMLTETSTNTLFDEKLYYDEAHNTNTPLFSGNISSATYSQGGKTYSFNFFYDGLSRLIKANYSNDYDKNMCNNTAYTYDEMSNILTLKRNGRQDDGSYGLIDNLSYNYIGNQQTAIIDKGANPTFKDAYNFVGKSDENIQYEYDADGNLTKDLNKNMQHIQYNLLNLPCYIDFKEKNVSYKYSATGQKLQINYIDKYKYPNESLSIDYCGNMIYENGILKQILVDGGYISLDGTKPTYHFFIKDHLGSNRVVVDQYGKIEQENQYYPFGGLTAESTSGGTQRYKYNGKELDRMYGIDWYDYGARYYDAAIGRFTSIDPLCEKYYNISPYAYCADNPIRLIDPDGRNPGDFFANPDDAAKDFGHCYNDNSIRDHLEYASSIFEVYKSDGTKGYTYTIPNKCQAKKSTASEAPLNKKLVGFVHSHGHYSGNDEHKYDDNHFSGAFVEKNRNNKTLVPVENLKTVSIRDIGLSNSAKVDMYVATPNGSLQKYDHNKGEITTISTNMPCDINDPTKLNKNYTSIVESNPISDAQILKIQRKIAYDQY